MLNWRYVTGAFQVKIPVTTAQVMLRPDEDALAVMTWRLQAMPASNRWYLVLKRYIDYLSARIIGLGGNPDTIPPSPDGAPVPGGQGELCFTGKVVELIYDCCGCLQAIVLEDCGRRHTLQTHEPELSAIALQACKERLQVTVCVTPDHHRICKFSIKCC
jgi:hypothetical protein